MNVLCPICNQIKFRLYCVTLFLAITQALPAWNSLTVNRNDGEEPLMLFSVDVDSLVCSKIGIDSLLYEDWQVQEIWTSDTIYRIPLVSIENILFKTVDNDEAIQNVVETSKQVSQFFMQSETLQELVEHLE